MITSNQLRIGLPVLYVPYHIQEECLFDERLYELSDKVERGFVSSWKLDVAYCRFYRPDSYDLRTLLNSEMCRCADLFLWKNAEQKSIDALIEMMNNAPVLYGWRVSNDQPTSVCSRLNDAEKESK